MADSIGPDVGQKIDAAGRVTYDFDGHLHAAGLDLDAGDTNTPPNDRRIRWLRTTDGALVADLYSYATATQRGSINARALTPDGVGVAAVNLLARSDGNVSSVLAGATDNNSNASVKVIDSDGASDFAMKAAGFSAGDLKWAVFNTDPANWVEADGRTLSVANGGTLRQLLINAGSPFGYDPPTSDPRVPDIRERFLLGKSSTIPYSVVGNTGGEETHRLTAAESGLPDHFHNIPVGSAGIGSYVANGSNHGSDVTSNYVGGGAQDAANAHNNMPPYFVLYALIKL